MQQAAVYDLCVAPPHVPDDARFTAAEFAVYREGYVMALTMALRAVQAAEQRYSLVTRTRKLDARQRRKGNA